MTFTEQRGVDRVVDVDFGGNLATTLKVMALNSAIAVYATNGNRAPYHSDARADGKMHRVARRWCCSRCRRRCSRQAQAEITEMARRPGTRIHNIAAQFPLAETAQAHLAVEKGDKLGTVIVDCAR